MSDFRKIMICFKIVTFKRFGRKIVKFKQIIFTRLNPQGRVAPLGAFAWMSQKRIWIGRLRHTRQIENHHKKDQILVYPNFLIENLFG